MLWLQVAGGSERTTLALGFGHSGACTGADAAGLVSINCRHQVNGELVRAFEVAGSKPDALVLEELGYRNTPRQSVQLADDKPGIRRKGMVDSGLQLRALRDAVIPGGFSFSVFANNPRAIAGGIRGYIMPLGSARGFERPRVRRLNPFPMGAARHASS